VSALSMLPTMIDVGADLRVRPVNEADLDPL
jgi:hypothetical protein